MGVKLYIFSYPSIYTCVLGAHMNRLIKTVLLSTNNICFELEIKKKIPVPYLIWRPEGRYAKTLKTSIFNNNTGHFPIQFNVVQIQS